MVPYDVMHERLMDIALILMLVGMYICMYAYGQYKYESGYHDGLRDKRKIDRQVRRGNIYRVK